VKWLFRKLGFSSHIPFPTFRFKTLQRDDGSRKTREKVPNPADSGSGETRKVAFFHGCYMNNNDPEVGRRIVSILRMLNVEVLVPEQTCCGLAATGNADLESARRYARRNGEILGDLVKQGYEIVYSCTSCGHTLIHDYPDRLQAPNGREISNHCWDVHEYLLTMIDDLAPRLNRVNRRIAYHIPCHLRHAAMGYPAAEILRHVPGIELSVMDEHCCGMSGSYGFKGKNQETAEELGLRAARHILSVNPDVMISDCGACRMQLGHLSKLDAIDPVDIISESLGLARYFGG
jgi:glycerol-3-phosphate dehydrogenase subunit C